MQGLAPLALAGQPVIVHAQVAGEQGRLLPVEVVDEPVSKFDELLAVCHGVFFPRMVEVKCPYGATRCATIYLPQRTQWRVSLKT